MKLPQRLNKLPAVLFIVFAACELAAGVRFSGLDLADAPADPADSRLLFSAFVPEPAGISRERKQLFSARLSGRTSINRLSILPEKMDILDGGKTLLIQDFYGIQSLPVSGGLPRAVPGLRSFTDTFTAPSQTSVSASPDGKWLLFIEPSSYGWGELLLINSVTGTRQLITPGIERPGRFFPASWSADSAFFLYAKSGKLYFYSVNNPSPPPVDERYRFVGEGGINSVCWAKNSFYYLKGSSLYKASHTGLSARTSYPGFLDIGDIAGIIPFEFDPNFDFFRVSDDGSAMVLSKGGRNIFYYPLEASEMREGRLPYFLAPHAASFSILWSGSTATILLAGKTPAAYRIRSGETNFSEIPPPPGVQALVSPGGNRVAVWGESGAVIYDYQSWKPTHIVSLRPVYSCVWSGRDELIAGSDERIDRFSFAGEGSAELVCLSSASEHGFEQNSDRVLARSGDHWFASDGNRWTEVPSPGPRTASIVSSSHRVFLDERPHGVFENMPMIRNFSGANTFPLIQAKTIERSAPGTSEKRPLPALQETDNIFSHGTRASRKIAFSFDIYDDDAGLYTVLDVLSRYRIQASFFLNGEFMRRHPGALALIAEAGHETASMFYAPIVLSDSRYHITREFITRGLSRSEDEYFSASGRELALLWHPPWYAASREIAAFAEEAGYITAGRDIDPGDWITREDARRTGIEQFHASDMIDAIMDTLQGGSIIPIRLGVLPGGRNNYLFNSLELLIDAVIRQGCQIVPVSELDGFPR